MASRSRRLIAPLSKPWVVLLTLPLLMALVAAFFVMGTQSALFGLAGKANRAQLQAQNQSLADHLRQMTMRAGEMTPALANAARAFVQQEDPAALARRLVDLMGLGEGVAWLIVALPDGRFFATHRERGDDGPGRILFSVRQASGGSETFVVDSDDRLRLVRADPETRYDPRERPFYQLALAQEGLAWTAPYLFFTDQVPGISAVRSLHDSTGALQAVVAVDLDLVSLSQALRASVPDARIRAVLMAEDLVLAAVAPRSGLPQGGRRELPTLQDFPDPVLRAYQRFGVPSPDGPQDVLAFRSEDESGRSQEFLVEELREMILGREWRVAQMVPRELIEAPVRSTVEQARLVAVIGGVVAVILAIFYALALIDANRRIDRAEARAAKAKADMRSIGAYYLVRLLGSGGMGAVWLARHHFLAKPAAMKFILPEAVAEDDQVVTRFKQEARILANLESMHTIRVYDFGQTPDGRLFYVMEMLDGIDLDRLVSDYGPQPPARVLSILRQACSSLGEAHAAGLVHRDIKPGNMVLSRHADDLDVLKVLDFGLATTRGKSHRLTQAGFVQGTPEFMAPEQARDGEVDGRADLYALGCVAFWLLAGRPPFTAANPMNLLLKHIEEEPPRLSMVSPQPIPLALERVVMWCLAKDPAGRPESAEALAAALDEVLCTDCEPWNGQDLRRWWAAMPKPDYRLDDGQQLTTGEAIMVHGPRESR